MQARANEVVEMGVGSLTGLTQHNVDIGLIVAKEMPPCFVNYKHRFIIFQKDQSCISMMVLGRISCLRQLLFAAYNVID